MGILSVKTRKKFFEMCVDYFTIGAEETENKYFDEFCFLPKYGLKDGYGFCYLLHVISYPNIELSGIPELRYYKPRFCFYTVLGEITTEDNQFWFPLNDEGKAKRLRIANEILSKLDNEMVVIRTVMLGDSDDDTYHVIEDKGGEILNKLPAKDYTFEDVCDFAWEVGYVVIDDFENQ